MLADEFESGGGSLAGKERVEHDPARVALDEGNVGKVVAAYLVNAVGDLEQAVLHIELCVAPQARIDRVWRGLVQPDVAFVRLKVPNDLAVRVLDRQRIRLANQTARRVC